MLDKSPCPKAGEYWEDRDGVIYGPLKEMENGDFQCPTGWRWNHLGVAFSNHRRDLMRRVEAPIDNTAPQLDALGATLAERKKTHGEYNDHADITQRLKDVIRSGRTYGQCAPHERETLDMIAHKIGRVVSGDPHFADHWHDIAGYARLSEERNK